MSRRFPLVLGELRADGWRVQRSGLRWLVPDGHCCSQEEVVATCTIGFARTSATVKSPPFWEERRDLTIALAVSHPGVLTVRQGSSMGGWLDQLQYYQSWSADDLVAELEVDAAASTPSLLLRGLAGRRMTELAEVRTGILSGWHDRVRAWTAEAAGWLSILSLGVCEQNGVFRGEDNDFGELLSQAGGALHAVHIADECLVPVSRVLVEQSQRSDAEDARMIEEMTRSVLDTGLPITPDDLLFMGSAARALRRRPLLERYDLFSRTGLETGGVDAVVLSIHAEPGVLLRHKRLGYHAFWHRFRVEAAGAAVREWLHVAFEQVPRTRVEVAADLQALVAAARLAGIRHVLVLNAMSTSGHEDVVSYRAFSGSLGDQLDSVSAKDTNLMLHELERDCGLAVIDLDALAAAHGGGAHLPDGIHASRRLQDAIRREIVHVLKSRGALAAAAPPSVAAA